MTAILPIRTPRRLRDRVRRKTPLHRPWRTLALVLALALVAAIAWPVWLQLSGNFHEVVPGQLYRSAQPSAEALERAVQRDGIRSVLNLRGDRPERGWYREEVAAAQRLGLTHADFAMSATRVPDAETMSRLVTLMRELPKPLLIHCRSGADRTGLAAALYLAGIDHAAEAEAEAQLSFAYGHVGLPVVSAAYAMDVAWEQLESALGFGES